MTEQLEDSRDFTDDDVAKAIDATEADARKYLVESKCSCGRIFQGVHQLLRRRRPYHYWIVQFWCKTCGDKLQTIFRLTDVNWRVP